MDKQGTIKNPVFWIMTITFIAFVVGAFIMYFCEFNLPRYSSALVKSFSTPVAISASSYLLYLSLNNKIKSILPLKILFFISYLVINSLILYFSFNFQQIIFYFEEKFLIFMLWTFYLLSSIVFIIYYCIRAIGTLEKINKLPDSISVILMFLTTVGLMILSYVLIIVLIGRFCEKASKHSGGSSSTEKEYTFTNSMGCKQTAYSEDGVHFYDYNSNHWTSDDGGKTMYED